MKILAKIDDHLLNLTSLFVETLIAVVAAPDYFHFDTVDLRLDISYYIFTNIKSGDKYSISFSDQIYICRYDFT